jgi:hypothetical protein
MNVFNKWKDKLSHFVDVRLNLIKLGFIERTSTVLGFVILTFIMLFLTLAVLLFIGIGLQEWFSSLLDDNRIAGAFLTAAFYLLFIIVLVLLRKPIVGAFAGLFIRVMTDSTDDDKEPDTAEEVKVSD